MNAILHLTIPVTILSNPTLITIKRTKYIIPKVPSFTFITPTHFPSKVKNPSYKMQPLLHVKWEHKYPTRIQFLQSNRETHFPITKLGKSICRAKIYDRTSHDEIVELTRLFVPYT
uniref:Uncharacterized protein n=1 Tax=Lepeophtheirus salmonis TaxID=72036 RepID=A0A0K2UT33_LEPSM